MAEHDDRAALALCSGAGRAARAAAVAGIATLLAVGCHVAAGGTPPPPSTVAVVLALAVPVCFWLSDRSWSTRQLAAIFLAVQASLHLVSMLAASDSLAHTSTPRMFTAHLLGTAVTTVVARYGERCLWATVDALGLRALQLPRTPSLPAWHAPWQPAGSIADTFADQCALATAPARGPPR